MPQFNYRGRDKEGRLRAGQRFSDSIDTLNAELIKEGISPIKITTSTPEQTFLNKLRDFFQGRNSLYNELTVFTRQMQLLHDAGVPITTALKQLAINTRSLRLQLALRGIVEHLEKGESLAHSMQYYPDIFSSLIINVVQIGENTGHLGEAFSHIHSYLKFEASTIKQLRSTFRYPIFVTLSIVFAIIILNIFVIPSFAKFYVNLDVALPWQTRLLILMSNIFVYYGIYLLIGFGIIFYFVYRYLKTPIGKLKWHKLELNIPLIGKLLKRILLIRFAESLSIILKAGISATQGLALVKNTMNNQYIVSQIEDAQESVERGVGFSQAISKIDLFTPLELQILAVGETNGELSPALNYIADFQSHEIEFDLKRMNDFIGPMLIGIISGLVLIIALGVYLPIWNMINLTHT